MSIMSLAKTDLYIYSMKYTMKMKCSSAFEEEPPLTVKCGVRR